MKKYLKFILIICIPILVLTSCKGGLWDRDYRDNLIVEIPDSDVTLIIKEWSWGLGSGAELNYLNKNGKEVTLGEAGGGDDGYCPFENGQYEIINNGDDTFTIKWYNFHIWEEATFNIPE